MKIKTTKEKRIFIIKTALRWFLYLVLIFICFLIMCSGTHLKPILLIPAAICISANTGELQSAAFGILCGFLIDISCNKLFGYNAVLLCIFCVAVSLLYSNLLRNKFINSFVVTSVVSFIHGLLDFNFYYDIWGYEDSGLIFRNYTVPVWIMTIISSVVIYGIITLINKLLMPKPHLSIEEAIKNFEE